MTSRLARFSTGSPRPLLLGALLAAVILALVAVGVPDRLALGDEGFGGSDSERAEATLAAELGYEPEPAFTLVVSGSESLSSAANELSLDTVEGQVQGIEGVAEVVEGVRSEDRLTTTLGVHLDRDTDDDTAEAVDEALREEVDPGPLQVLVAGSFPVADAARSALLDDVPKLLLIALPLVLLVLAGSLGLRLGLASLLGGTLAAGAAVVALGLVGQVHELQTVALAAGATVAFVAAIEASAMLLYRYREESATLGAGPEALEYSLHIVLKGSGIGMASAALVGLALLAVPMDVVDSIGIGIFLGALLGPTLALPPMAAALFLRAREEVGEPLPLVAEGEPAGGGPRSFGLFLRVGRGRRVATLVVVPLVVCAFIAIPLFDSEAIGLSAGELPADDPTTVAEAELAATFGQGAGGPLLVITGSPPEAPSLTIYRAAIAELEQVERVGRALPAGGLSFFEVTPAARPRSLEAQQIAVDVAEVPGPPDRRIAGPAAELSDAGEGLGDDLPLVAILVLIGTAAVWGWLFRAVHGPLLAAASIVGPLVGLGAVVFVFERGRLTDLLDYAASGAPHLTTYALVGSVLLALGVSRGAHVATALREELVLGGGMAGSLARATLLTLTPAVIATFAGVVAIGVWLGAPLLGAKEVALGLSVGLVADLVLTRCLAGPALVRLAARSGR